MPVLPIVGHRNGREDLLEHAIPGFEPLTVKRFDAETVEAGRGAGIVPGHCRDAEIHLLNLPIGP